MLFKEEKALKVAKAVAIKNVNEYVEVELNEEWQSDRLIRWGWTTEEVRS